MGDTIRYPSMGTVKKAAEIYGLSPSYIRRLCKTGKIRYVNAGHMWLVNLDSGETVLDCDTMAAFAVGMNETLSIRDALILSLIIDEQRCPKTQLMEFAARPHSKRNKRRMGELLTVAFEDEGIVPDKERCHAGIAMLLDIADAAPVPYCVQPLAVVAYTLWWLGDSRAVTMALQCLLLDEECSLAAMVFSAAQRGVAPAWCSG